MQIIYFEKVKIFLTLNLPQYRVGLRENLPRVPDQLMIYSGVCFAVLQSFLLRTIENGRWLTSENTKWMSTVKIFYHFWNLREKKEGLRWKNMLKQGAYKEKKIFTFDFTLGYSQ